MCLYMLYFVDSLNILSSLSGFLKVVLLTMDDAETVDFTGENFSLGDFAQPYDSESIDSESMLFSMRSRVSGSDQEMSSMRVANSAFVSVTYDPICTHSLKD